MANDLYHLNRRLQTPLPHGWRVLAAALALMLCGPAWSVAQDIPALDAPGGGFGEFVPDFKESEAAKNFKIHVVASHSQVASGQTFRVALACDLADGWVYYSPDPGPIVIAGSLGVQAGPMRVKQVRWQADHAKTTDYGEGPVANNVYTGRFVIYAELATPADAAPGEYEITLSPRGQICKDVCINLDGDDAISASVMVQVGPAGVADSAWTDELSAGWDESMSASALKTSHSSSPTPSGAIGSASAAVAGYTVWAGLGLALLAGLTLNIMPCVLPIIPLRIYSLVSMAGESRRRFVTLGLAFAQGILLFFLALAAVSAGLRLLGSGTIDLNEHFKYPWVRILIAMVLLALSANLWGLFNVIVPSKVAGLGQDSASKGHLAAVGMGLMMAVLSTPCSFWLMALALAWAQLQPLWLGTLAIVIIGVGMALPHAVLASLPDLVKLLPKPGAWMEYFKQTMGFLLIPAVLYLLSTLPERGGWPWLVGGFGVVLVFALWIWGSWVRYDAPLRRKMVVRGTAVALAVASGLYLLPEPGRGGVQFEPFSAQRIAQAGKDGQVVVIKVTASWCTECKILDFRVFGRPEIAKAFRDGQVVAIEADVTEKSSAAALWVKANGGGAPPVTLIYPASGSPPQTIVGVFGQEDMIRYLAEAQGVKPGS